MFTRVIKKKDNKKYLYIVESYREKGKIKQRSIGALGRLDILQDTNKLELLARSILKYCKQKESLFDISKVKEENRKIWGVPRVYRKIWNMFSFDELLKKILQNKKIEYDLFSTVFLMLMDRLSSPKSKLKSYEEQNRYYGVKENKLQHLYRALDVLKENKEAIEKYIFNKNKDLFNMRLDVVFYDVTTIYFESIQADKLKDFGFSKDLKVNEVQVVLGLLVDKNGRPVGFDLFPGNKFEGHTLETALEKLKEKFQINRVIIVGDRAMLSRNNINLIKSKEYEYVVGARIKNEQKDIKKKIFNKAGYTVVHNQDTDEIFKYKVIKNKDDVLIITWSKKRAEKDRHDRERLVQKATEMLKKGKSQAITKRGSRKYIDIKIEKSPTLDIEKIKQDAQWDGYYGIRNNCTALTAEDVISVYHDLWKVEESFRILKSHLEARPVFHWTPKRIKGHITLCFIAFLLERTLELELKKNKIEYSPQKIRKVLNSLQVSSLKVESQEFYLRSKIDNLSKKILKALKIKIPPNICPLENF